MSGIQGIGSATSGVGQADHPSKVGEAEKKVDPKLHQMAKEFEAMFVRQILTTAKITGSGKQDAYGGMGVDALATNISSGSGLGLARQIEDTIRHAERGHVAPAAAAVSGAPAGAAATAANDLTAQSLANSGAISAISATSLKSTKE